MKFPSFDLTGKVALVTGGSISKTALRDTRMAGEIARYGADE